MKRARKSIASIIVITFIVTCIGNYKAVYAEGEQSLEVNYATEELNESNVKFATEEVKKAELVEDNIEDELEVVKQPAVLEIVETYGNIYDFKNYYNNYIKVIFKQGPKIHDVKVTMVKSDDPSKFIIYDNYEDCSNY